MIGTLETSHYTKTHTEYPHKIIAISLVQLQEVTQSPGQPIKIYNPMFLATKPKSFVDRNCGVRSVREI